MSDKPYTPTTEQVRGFWASDGRYQPAAKSYSPFEGEAEFDRWLAQVKAEALREAVTYFESEVGPTELLEQSVDEEGRYWFGATESWEHQGVFMAWLRARAARLEGEAP